jgi:DNA repair protein RadA
MPEKKGRGLQAIKGIGPEAEAKLIKKGIEAIEDLAALSIDEICDYLDIKELDNAIAIRRQAVSMAKNTVFLMSAKEYDEKVASKRLTIRTGSKEIDELIGGGLKTGASITASGAFGSGKTQLGYCLLVNTILPEEKGGLGKSVVFISTEDSWKKERVEQILRHRKTSDEEMDKLFSERVFVVDAYHTDDIVCAVSAIDEDFVKEKNLGLVIVDSILGLFRTEFVGRGELAERQQKLATVLADLRKAAGILNVAAYYTNQIVDKPGVMFGPTEEMAGGNILKHLGGTHLWLRKGKADARVAGIKDAPDLPPRECIFYITEKGIESEKPK